MTTGLHFEFCFLAVYFLNLCSIHSAKNKHGIDARMLKSMYHGSQN